MRVRLSPNTSRYLQQEGAYLRQHSRAAASAFADNMRRAFLDLSVFAKAGFDGEQSPHPKARRLIRNGYRIDYTIRKDHVWVMSISSSVNTPLAIASDDPDYEV